VYYKGSSLGTVKLIFASTESSLPFDFNVAKNLKFLYNIFIE